jgi:hypothetical protein
MQNGNKNIFENRVIHVFDILSRHPLEQSVVKNLHDLTFSTNMLRMSQSVVQI